MQPDLQQLRLHISGVIQERSPMQYETDLFANCYQIIPLLHFQICIFCLFFLEISLEIITGTVTVRDCRDILFSIFLVCFLEVYLMIT